MCGIAGIFFFDSSGVVDGPELLRMRESLVHRGPDGGQSWTSGDRKVGLAHRRLSIIDLSAAASQPMCNETGDIWVTFNGEIYNHVRLRNELEQLGHRFKTDHSDTEVLVHGYETWGLDGLLRRLDGDYAFGLWDGHTRKLFLARDRVGVKPLYFSCRAGVLSFASEIKALVASGRVQPEMSTVAMYHYLTFLTPPAPLTMFQGVYKLPAGHCLELGQGGRPGVRAYWEPRPGQSPASALRRQDGGGLDEEYARGVLERLKRSVQKRMISDVPCGAFLSGGIDSSTNVALMSQFSDRPVRTFTIGYKDHPDANELTNAREISERFGTEHRDILIDESEMRSYLGQLIYSQDEPIADWVCIPLYFVAKLAKESGVTVVQVGEGADEQFVGYPHYLKYAHLHRYFYQPFSRALPAGLRTAIARAAIALASKYPGFSQYAEFIDRAARRREHFWSGATVFHDVKKKQLLRQLPPAAVPNEYRIVPPQYAEYETHNIALEFSRSLNTGGARHDLMTQIAYNELKLRIPELLLMRMDKITMSVSQEARVPFLDHELVEWTMDIPMARKIPGGGTKHILKKAVRGLIPDAVIDRPKVGFGAPMAQWLRGGFGTAVEAYLARSRLLNSGIFNCESIRSLLARHRSGRADESMAIWALFNLAAWHEHWVEGARTIEFDS